MNTGIADSGMLQQLRDVLGRLVQLCPFLGCGRVVSSRGLCSGHYQQDFRGRELQPLRDHNKRPCPTRDCVEPRHVDGQCLLHYLDFTLCRFRGCIRTRTSGRWCQLHRLPEASGKPMAPTGKDIGQAATVEEEKAWHEWREQQDSNSYWAAETDHAAIKTTVTPRASVSGEDDFSDPIGSGPAEIPVAGGDFDWCGWDTADHAEQPDEVEEYSETDRGCEMPGCDEEQQSKGYCPTHLGQQPGPLCRKPKCGAPAAVKGLCSIHLSLTRANARAVAEGTSRWVRAS